MLGWGSDVRLYVDIATLRAELPVRLASGPLVLKRARGNGGLGVWKIEIGMPGTTPTLTSVVHVQHAYDGAMDIVPLATFLDGLSSYLDSGGRLVEQPFLARGDEGMVRCYLSGMTVVGFAQHRARGFLPSRSGSNEVMYGAGDVAFQALRSTMEREWAPAMCRSIGLAEDALPAIWDADFLRGPKTPAGEDTWVLCEINASCVSPFPEEAAETIAARVLGRVARRRITS